MSTRAITIGIAVIVLAGLAYYVGTSRTAEPTAETATTTSQQTVQDPKVAETSSAVAGEWKSTDDAKYTRTFRADGTVTDTYEGDASATTNGTWTVFTSATELPVGVSFPLDTGTSYIQVAMNGEVFNYRVSSVTASELELIYMDRGGVLRFSKVN